MCVTSSKKSVTGLQIVNSSDMNIVKVNTACE